MKTCPACGSHCRLSDVRCPNCDAAVGAPRRSSVARMLGLALVIPGCAQQIDTGVQAEYGVPDTAQYADADTDGWSTADGDCDDDDATVHPEAEETAGDGVDSNCDGSDDT